jgi:hypothetical protein
MWIEFLKIEFYRHTRAMRAEFRPKDKSVALFLLENVAVLLSTVSV